MTTTLKRATGRSSLVLSAKAPSLALLVRSVLGALLVVVTLALSASSAQAATNRWYSVPSAHGAQASAIMTYFVKGSATGRAGGQIWLNNPTTTKVYVQFKPNEGGTWNRATVNVVRAAYYFNWSDNFTLNYSGFMFRICKDQLGLDSCGTPVKITG